MLEEQQAGPAALQVVGDAVRVDTALPISPLDPRQGRIKQEDTRELRSAHSSGEADYQVDLASLPCTLTCVSAADQPQCANDQGLCIACRLIELCTYHPYLLHGCSKLKVYRHSSPPLHAAAKLWLYANPCCKTVVDSVTGFTGAVHIQAPGH